MTLGELFDLISQNPFIVLFYFIALILTTILAGIMGKNEGNISPWKYLYSVLIYMAAIPGIFAITLNIYLFLFERISIFDTNLYTQILPIISMLVCFWLIRRNVAFDEIPGFEKLSGLVLIIAALMTIMWICDRTHIIAITFVPFYWVLIIFLLVLFLVLLGWKKMFTN